MAVHPLRGMRLPIVRLERDWSGRRYVIAEHPLAGRLRLPVEWTDRGVPPSPPRIDGKELRLAVTSMVMLARACRVALCQKLDKGDALETLHANTEHKNRCANAGSTGPLGDDVDDCETRSARSVGDARAQTAAHRGARNRGRR